MTSDKDFSHGSPRRHQRARPANWVTRENVKRLAIGLVAALVLYAAYTTYLNWGAGLRLPETEARAEEFLAALRENRIEDAYSMTTFRFGWRIGRRGLRELVAKYPAFQNVPGGGTLDLKSRRIYIRAFRYFMIPKAPEIPKGGGDYLPVRIALVIGNDGDWKIDDIVIPE